MKYLSCIAICLSLIACNTNSVYSNTGVENFSITDDCNIKQKIPLKMLGDDTFFVESFCLLDSDDVPFKAKYFLVKGNKLELLGIKESQGNSLPKNQAVSLYQSKNHSLILLSITSWKLCCHPRAEGSLYEVDMYKVTKKNNNYLITKIPSHQFGFDNFGLEGNTYDTGAESHYSYKTVASLKEKLKDINF